MQKEYQKPFMPGIKYELADILALNYAKSKLKRKVAHEDAIYKDRFELLSGLSTNELHEMHLFMNNDHENLNHEKATNGHVQTLDDYLKKLHEICGMCFPPGNNGYVARLRSSIEDELNKLSHKNKRLYSIYKNDYEVLKQHPFINIKNAKEELILTS